MSDHQKHHAARPDRGKATDAEKAITHVHYRTVAQHLFQIALSKGDETNNQNIADTREQR